MSHAHAVVISCVDNRLKDPRTLMFWHLLGRRADLITLPGASICVSHLVSFESSVDESTHVISADFALESLHLCVSAHSPKEIWVVAHQDCAATNMLELTEPSMSQHKCMLAQLYNYQESIAILEQIFGIPVRLFYQTLGNKVIKL